MSSKRLSRHEVVIAASVTAVVLALGCGETARFLRQATYPPDFRYISQEELDGVMWQLAGRVHELERQLEVRSHEPAGEVDLDTVATLLAEIERQARSLESDGGGSTHPYFRESLTDFLAHVEHARRGLRREPPVLTSADEVWRACAGCHNRR